MSTLSWTDYRGRVVELTDEGWAHVLARHANMRGKQELIGRAISEATLVLRDDDNRLIEHHYLRRRSDLFLRVVVLHRPTPLGW